MVLHWAINDWEGPPEHIYPPNTHKIDDKAVQTPFEGNRVVRLSFSKADAPERIVFVLKELQPENWINNGSCYSVQLKPAGVSQLVQRVLDMEGNADHWSLKDRFVLANDVLDGLAAAGADGMSFLFTWLRMSSNKILTWARRANYQSKDIAWMQKVVSERMTDKARSCPDPWARLYARLALAGLPRGGGNGDDIRMGILHIMREYGIKEGHRPGHDEPFLEQWHQKLHQNTTPEDVTICEAYLAYLHSGNHDDYWRVLWDNGKITKERLETMHNPIKAWPQHMPHLINAFKGYLWTLKCCHGGADMDTAAEMAKGHLDGDTVWMIFDMLQNRAEWWVPGKILEIRHRLADAWRGSGSRDVLLLDIALDNYFRTCIERTDRSSLNGDSLIDLIGLVLDNSAIGEEAPEIAQCARLWGRVKNSDGRWSKDWSLTALAAVQRVELSLAAFADQMCSQVQPHAEAFGKACQLDPAFITNFGEEVVRGQPVFVLSGLLQDLEKSLRAAAGAGPWQVISQVPSAGEVCVRELADMQGEAFAAPTVVFSQHLGGMEDIPPGVTAVLTESTTDVLSHVAIRARSQGVLLATCFDEAEWARLTAMKGQHIGLEVTPSGEVVATPMDAPPDGAAAGAGARQPHRLKLKQPDPVAAWAISEAQFTPGVVGAKAYNLAKLRSTLPSDVRVPSSVAVPFGVFEAVMAHPANAGPAAQLAKLQAELGNARVGGGIPPALAAARKVVRSELTAPPELIQELSAVASAAGLPGADSWAQPNSNSWPAVWTAITKVWASQWGDRAWLSRQACQVPEGDLKMSVLLQEIADGSYAFVLHTANPLTGQLGEIFGELVPGLGEVLVGNYPGRALSFSIPPGSGSPELHSLPSKRVGLYVPHGGTLIARSDTNGEDLEAFAGAGLYDSVPVIPLLETTLEAADQPLLWDGHMRGQLISSISQVGKAVEGAFGGVAQDIEGVVLPDGQVVVVQSRPQVLPTAAGSNGSSR
jgi:alpha-glucan,water dikinase